MAESGSSLFKRIRSAKNSLENAEQSFLDNKSVRGELDLMLAEAELKNLRRKKDVPWNWSRQLLAVCGAMLLCIAGLGGWMFAKGENKPVVPTVENTATVVQEKIPSKEKNSKVSETGEAVARPSDKVHNTSEPESPVKPRVSSEELRRLVRSAKVELSKNK